MLYYSKLYKNILIIFTMIIPVRCFSCGKVVGSLWEKYEKLLAEGKTQKEALDEVGAVRFCCRSTIMSHVENIDIVGAYK
jgi:DNA-directed RNA polymerase subunit N (RpoN/RPB10)